MASRWTATRLATNPLLAVDPASATLDNINGPSVIEAPDWLTGRLGRFHLYFAHHRGDAIRLAYADEVGGPWTIHHQPVLDLAHTPFDDHIASPDVHVDHNERRLRLYFHGRRTTEVDQYTHVSLSADGLTFTVTDDKPLGPPYWRSFHWNDAHYGLALPGLLFRSPDGFGDVEPGPLLFPSTRVECGDGGELMFGVRHTAVLVDGDRLHIWYSNRGDAPERLLHTTVDLVDDWNRWTLSESTEQLRPEGHVEGADQPISPSHRGAVFHPVNQLRDPAILAVDDDLYLFYAIAGEQGIAGARLHAVSQGELHEER